MADVAAVPGPVDPADLRSFHALAAADADLSAGVRDRHAITDQLENAESTEPTLIAEPAENNETIDPAEPTDRIDPADPMLRMEPAEPMLRIDPADPIDKIEPAGPLVRADCHELIDRDPRWLRRIPAFSHLNRSAWSRQERVLARTAPRPAARVRRAHGCRSAGGISGGLRRRVSDLAVLMSRPGRNHRGRSKVRTGMAAGHKITITPSTQHVEVSIGGERLAESDRPVLLDETGLPTRYYLPAEDVRGELLRPTESVTTCPFKGQAAYWSVEVGGNVHDDVVWSYRNPIPGAEGIADLMCFYNERVELTINGAHLPSPKTMFSR